MISSRNNSVDIARGIAMIAIILGHLGISAIDRIVYTFHIPIFFLITGYYMNTSQSLACIAKKRFRTVIIPYFLACVGVIVGACVFNNVGKDILINTLSTKDVLLQWGYASLYASGETYQEPFLIIGIGAIWFLWATFWGIIFLCMIKKISSPYRILAVLGLFALGYYTKSVCWLPLSIQAGCCATFFMYVGNLAKELQPAYEHTSPEVKVSLFAISLCVWINFILQFQSFALVGCDIGRGALDVIGSLCASYVIIILCKTLGKAPLFICKVLAFLGQYSLFMLVAHIIELNTFPWFMVSYKLAMLGYGLVAQYIVLIVCKFVWIIGITLICAKMNPIRRLFGMKPLIKNQT